MFTLTDGNMEWKNKMLLKGNNESPRHNTVFIGHHTCRANVT